MSGYIITSLGGARNSNIWSLIALSWFDLQMTHWTRWQSTIQFLVSALSVKYWQNRLNMWHIYCVKTCWLLSAPLRLKLLWTCTHQPMWTVGVGWECGGGCGAHPRDLIAIHVNESPWIKRRPKAYLHRVKMHVAAEVKFTQSFTSGWNLCPSRPPHPPCLQWSCWIDRETQPVS